MFIRFHREHALKILPRHGQQLLRRVRQKSNLMQEESICPAAQSEVLPHVGQVLFQPFPILDQRLARRGHGRTEARPIGLARKQRRYTALHACQPAIDIGEQLDGELGERRNGAQVEFGLFQNRRNIFGACHNFS